MRRFFYIACNQKWRFLLIPILVFGALSFENAYGASSGLKIEIALDADQFPVGFPIALRMVITNDSQWSIYTKKGFSQTEFYRSLILTDPNGKKRIYIPATIPVDTMPPALIYGNRQVSLAQQLLPGVVKTVTIADLAQLFPIVDSVPGWYTLEAQQPFVRFAGTIAIENFGVLGLADDPDKWQGTVNSNKVQFYLYPGAGGQLTVQVLDNAVVPPAPLFQVPVKVFKSADIPADNPAAETWSKVKAQLEGETDNSGQTLWASETTPCLIGDDYTVIARYSDEYQEDTIGSSDSGWQTGCAGLVQRTLGFGQAPPQDEEIITISGSAYYYPEGGRYRASFSMDISTESVPSGLLKYYYTKTRMSFSSSEITEVVSLNGNSVSIKGTGTVNRAGSYTFEANVVDGSPDSFAIIIKDQNDNIYYSTTPTTISGGNLIVIIE